LGEPTVTTQPDADGALAIPPEAMVAGAVLFVVLLYIILYVRGLVDEGRYQDGYVVESCPVCRVGKLNVEHRKTRVLGIPRVRHTVRCNNCRSVLREVGLRRWRYAVDRIENELLFDQYNGKQIRDEELIALAQNPVSRNRPLTPPEFIDDSET